MGLMYVTLLCYSPPMSSPLNRAIEIVGGQTSLAALIGKKQSNVSMWLRRKKVAAECCIAIEAATGGQVTRHDLRPDVFGPAPATASTNQPSA